MISTVVKNSLILVKKKSLKSTQNLKIKINNITINIQTAVAALKVIHQPLFRKLIKT
jgi:hypothetical protein